MRSSIPGSSFAVILSLAVGCFFASSAFGQDPQVFWEHASVYRDEWGVPHVYGDDLESMAFAFGYAQAEDHLETMLLAYRTANGRAAEVLGDSMALSDEFSLKLGHSMVARSALVNADAMTRDLCTGFSIGVNAWIVAHPDKVPAWADGVRPEDVLALLHCYLMSFAPFDLPNTWRRAPAAVSGNAWALAPSRTDNGRSLLVINPHTAYDGPFQWYEAHLVCQDMNVAGATLFGLPVILQGHNPVLGWALTPNQPDFADMYIESALDASEAPKKEAKKLEPFQDRMLQFLLLANARTYYVNSPSGLVERAVSCLDTPRGPVMGTLRGRMCSWRIGGYHELGALAQFVEMGRAGDLASFRAAFSMHQLPCFHVVYADQQGNISYIYNAKTGNKAVFDRMPGMGSEEEELARPPAMIDWNTPMPAANSAFKWGNIIPVAALPSLVNPESGYVQACGNPPWAATDQSGIAPDALPRWFAIDRDTFRAQRVRRLLAMGKRSFRDCQSMLYDTVVPFAMETVPRLLKVADERAAFVNAAHPDLALGLDILRDWNFLADPGSTGMTLFEAWWTALRAQQPASAGWRIVAQTDATVYNALLNGGPGIEEAALNAAADAARMMRNEYQSLTVPWGDVHTLRRGTKEVGVPGAVAGEPIFAASDFVYDNRKWPVTYGYGYAMVVEFGDTPEAVSVAPFGVSEDPSSPHYADQMDLLSQRRFKISRFRFDDVQRNTSRARGKYLYLRPKGVEALINIRSTQTIEARVMSKTEVEAALPQGQVPFCLYMEVQLAPQNAAAETTMDVYIPPELCSREDFAHLSLYSCGSDLVWTRVESQENDVESRTLRAVNAAGPRLYVVLGPEQYRAAQLEMQKERPVPLFPADRPPAADATGLPLPMPLAPQLPSGKKFVFKKGEKGTPPRHEIPKIEIPEDYDDGGEFRYSKPKTPDVSYMEPQQLSEQRRQQLEELEKRNRKVLKKAGLLPPDPPKKDKKKKTNVEQPAKADAGKSTAQQPEKKRGIFNFTGRKKNL